MKKLLKSIWIFFALALVWIGIFCIPVSSLLSSNASQASPADVISLAAGEHHSAALRADGTVWAWGSNSHGQLGNGEISPEGRATPSQVPNLTGVTAIASGSLHTIALKADGTVWTWGDNQDGQLGAGTASAMPQVNPVQVPSLKDVVYIAAGGGHSIAVDRNGSVWVWGNNGSGQLADGTATMRPAPVQASVSGPGMFAGGGSHSVLADSNGKVFTWGANDSGQLGNGTTVGSLLPESIGIHPDNTIPGEYVAAVAAGGGYPLPEAGQNHSLALLKDGSVAAWGNNLYGQTGDGTAGNTRLTPVLITTLEGIGAVAAGLNHSVALKDDGTVWAWGDNEFGELGDDTTTERNTPVQVTGIAGVVSIAARGDFTLALKNDGTVWAWGANSHGELGDGTTTDRHAPVRVIGLDSARYSISGQLTSAGSGLPGVSVSLSGAASVTTTTDSTGRYGFTGLANGKYTITPILAGYGLTPRSRTVDVNGGDANGLDFTALPGYSISGQVTSGGSGLQGVTVNLSGAVSAGTVTDSSGNFSFTGLANGKYTITPALAGYGFTPQNQTANVNGADTNGLIFTALSANASEKKVGATPGGVSGQVTIGVAGLQGVTITLTGAGSGTTTTDSVGNYSFTGLADGKYTITPTMAGYKFSPKKRTAKVKGANVAAPNIAATFLGFSLSGQVTHNSSGLSGVAISLTGSAAKSGKTDSKGNYKFTGLPNGDYTITPARNGYTFSPENASATVSGGNATVGSIAATFIGCSISGQVTGAGSVFEGVSISLSGAASGSTTTGSGGNYSFTGLANGKYKIVPVLTGYKFTPTKRTVNVKGANVTGQNFTTPSSPPPTGFSISGQVTKGGLGVSGVALSLSGDASGRTHADSQGYYRLSGVANGNYTITPVSYTYGLTPENRSVSVNGQDVSGQNFEASGGNGEGGVSIWLDSCYYGIAEATTVDFEGRASGPVGTEIYISIFEGDCNNYDPNFTSLPDSCDAWGSCVRTDTDPAETGWIAHGTFYFFEMGQLHLSAVVMARDTTTNPHTILKSQCIPMICDLPPLAKEKGGRFSLARRDGE
jgi:alpha-tubulin suppressor-like RCC1 family protein